jgi:hypothetical protein
MNASLAVFGLSKVITGKWDQVLLFAVVILVGTFTAGYMLTRLFCCISLLWRVFPVKSKPSLPRGAVLMPMLEARRAKKLRFHGKQHHTGDEEEAHISFKDRNKDEPFDYNAFDELMEYEDEWNEDPRYEELGWSAQALRSKKTKRMLNKYHGLESGLSSDNDIINSYSSACIVQPKATYDQSIASLIKSGYKVAKIGRKFVPLAPPNCDSKQFYRALASVFDMKKTYDEILQEFQDRKESFWGNFGALLEKQEAVLESKNAIVKSAPGEATKEVSIGEGPHVQQGPNCVESSLKTPTRETRSIAVGTTGRSRVENSLQPIQSKVGDVELRRLDLGGFVSVYQVFVFGKTERHPFHSLRHLEWDVVSKHFGALYCDENYGIYTAEGSLTVPKVTKIEKDQVTCEWARADGKKAFSTGVITDGWEKPLVVASYSTSDPTSSSTSGAGVSGAPVYGASGNLLGFHEGSLGAESHFFVRSVSVTPKKIKSNEAWDKLRVDFIKFLSTVITLNADVSEKGDLGGNYMLGDLKFRRPFPAEKVDRTWFATNLSPEGSRIWVKPGMRIDEVQDFLKIEKTIGSNGFPQLFSGLHAKTFAHQKRFVSSAAYRRDTFETVLGELDLNTSVGYPLKIDFRSKKELLDFMGIDGFLDHCEVTYQDIVKGRQTRPYCWNVFMKEDKYSAKKVTSGAYRTIQGADVFFVVLNRAVWKPSYDAAVANYQIKDSTRVAGESYLFEGTTFLTFNVNDMYGMSKDLGSYIHDSVGFDYTKFDRNAPIGSWDLAYDCLGTITELKGLRDYMVLSSNSGPMCVDGEDVCEGRKGGNPSGHPFTSYHNCVLNLYFLWSYWRSRRGPDSMTLAAHVTGDDCIVRTSKPPGTYPSYVGSKYGVDVKIEGTSGCKKNKDGEVVLRWSAPYVGLRMLRERGGVTYPLAIDVRRRLSTLGQPSHRSKIEYDVLEQSVLFSMLAWLVALYWDVLDLNETPFEEPALAFDSAYLRWRQKQPPHEVSGGVYGAQVECLKEPHEAWMFLMGLKLENCLQPSSGGTILTMTTAIHERFADKVAGRPYKQLNAAQKKEVDRRAQQSKADSGEQVSGRRKRGGEEAGIAFGAGPAKLARTADLPAIDSVKTARNVLKLAPARWDPWSNREHYELALRLAQMYPAKYDFLPSAFLRASRPHKVVRARDIKTFTIADGQTCIIMPGFWSGSATTSINSIAYWLGTTGTDVTAVTVSGQAFDVQPRSIAPARDPGVSGAADGAEAFCPGPGFISVECRRTDLTKNYPLVGVFGDTPSHRMMSSGSGQIETSEGSGHLQELLFNRDNDAGRPLASALGGSFTSNLERERIKNAYVSWGTPSLVNGAMEFGSVYTGTVNTLAAAQALPGIEIVNDTGASVEVRYGVLQQFAAPVSGPYAAFVGDVAQESECSVPRSCMMVSNTAGLGMSIMDAAHQAQSRLAGMNGQIAHLTRSNHDLAVVSKLHSPNVSSTYTEKAHDTNSFAQALGGSLLKLAESAGAGFARGLSGSGAAFGYQSESTQAGAMLRLGATGAIAAAAA